MKKAVLTTLCILLLNTGCFALDSTTSQIQKLEKSYFGYDYPGESDTKRLDRLEKAVYGMPSHLPSAQRIQKLNKDLQPAILNSDSDSTNVAQSEPAQELPPAEKDVKYPVVDKIEQKVFKKSFTNEDIYKRLSRLEKQVYKKESSSSLSERVDSLRASVLANASVRDESPVTLDGYDPRISNSDSNEKILDFPDPDSDSQYNYYTPQNTKNRIAKPEQTFRYNDNPAQSYDVELLEKTVLGRKFSGEPVKSRLTRLEHAVFQKTFSDDEDARVQRLLAATTAQKTAKHYDSNKLMQHLNTGIQIGGILLMVLAMIL